MTYSGLQRVSKYKKPNKKKVFFIVLMTCFNFLNIVLSQ